MDYVVLDTDVASFSFRRRLPAGMTAQLTGKVWWLTFVTVGELTQWMRLRNWSTRNQSALEAWLSGFALVDSSHQAAQLWGMLSAEGKRRGRARPINDTWIAACCLAEGLPLATLNTKDYADFREHHGLSLIGG